MDVAQAEKPTSEKRIKMLTGALIDARVTLRRCEGALMSHGGDRVMIDEVDREISNIESRIEIFGDESQ